MKKIAIAFAALIAAFGFSSCNKEQIETPSTDIKLNIKVANLDDESADTKAIKTDWANGDKINIWFDQTSYANPDLVLTFDGANWNAGTLNKTPNANGNLIVLYEGYNDWSKYTHTSDYLYPTTYDDSPFIYAQPIAYKNNGSISYTYDAGANTLTANLNSWSPLTKIQVVVTNLDPANASNYALKETNMMRGVAYLGGSLIAYSNSSVGGYTLGVSNGDGVAFYFFGHNNGSDVANWTFTLKDYAAGTEKTYSVSDKALPTSSTRIKGVKLSAENFE